MLERFLDINSKNLENKTAWDMLQEDNKEIKDMLRRVGAKPGSSNSYPNLKYQSSLSTAGLIWPNKLGREIRKVSEERRSVFMVVAVLIATLTYQAVLTPPGGLWQDNGLCINTTEAAGSNYPGYNIQLSPFNFFKKIPPSNKTVGSSNYPKIIYLSHSNTTLACEHKAGTAIALGNSFYSFLCFNTFLFSVSSSLIVILILNFYIKFLFLVLNITLCFSYFYLVQTITDDADGVGVILLESIAGSYFVLIQLLFWKY